MKKNKKILLSIASLAMTTAPIVSLGNCGSKSQPAPTLHSIELSGEYKTNYYVGENLDLTGLVVTGNFEDGTNRPLTTSEYTTSPAAGTALTVNDTSVTVTAVVGDVTKEQSFDITVSPVVLESITLNTDSTKTNYYVGENLDLTGLVVTGHFDNGSSRILSNEDYTTDPKEGTALKESDKTVTVTATVDGVKKTNTFSITVSPVVLESITLNTDSTKTNYYVGENLDLTGLVVTGTFSDGNSRALEAGEYTTSPASGSKLSTTGKITVTVTAVADASITKTFDVSVADPVLQSITLDTTRVQLQYYADNSLDLTGLVVTGTFSDGNSRALETTEYTTSPADGDQLRSGPTIVTVTADVGGISKKQIFNVYAYDAYQWSLDATNVTCSLTGFRTYFPNTTIKIPSTHYDNPTSLSYEVTSIGSEAFSTISDVVNLIIPDSVKTIGNKAFYACGNLASVELGEGVRSIEESAFELDRLITTITIPVSVKLIGNYAFSECYGLTKINYNGTSSAWNSISFGRGWHNRIPATVVHCADGVDVPLFPFNES